MKNIHFETIDSTNTYAKSLCEKKLQNNNSLENLNELYITADAQTAGRGRLGRSFYSPYSTGLYMSIIHTPGPDSPKNPAIYTSTAAVAVCRTLDNFFNLSTQIKWVNDIYLGGKKICGILTEGVLNSKTTGTAFDVSPFAAVIIGIGINICKQDFPADIKHRAGSVGDFTDNVEAGKKTLSLLAKQITQECFNILSSREKITLALQEYKNRSFIIGKTVTVHPIIDNAANDYNAIVTGITDDAKLVVKLTDDSTKTLDSGEISIKM